MYIVSVGDVEAVREGHQSEVLLSIADEFPPDRCFTLVFRGRRGNLDLVAESAEEARSWINGIRKLIDNLENMGQREKLDQYPLLRLYLSVYHSALCPSYTHTKVSHRLNGIKKTLKYTGTAALLMSSRFLIYLD